jgi:hypothetical protein
MHILIIKEKLKKKKKRNIFVVWFFETESYVAQAGLKLLTLLPQPPEC